MKKAKAPAKPKASAEAPKMAAPKKAEAPKVEKIEPVAAPTVKAKAPDAPEARC